MLSKRLLDLLNRQVNKELWSSYIYLGISNFYKGKGLDGFASWFKRQAEEEVEHAEKFIDYIYDEGGEVTLDPIEAPRHEYTDYKEPLVYQLEHEKLVTSLIHEIYAASLEEKDYRTTLFLNFFVSEQAEEEKVAAGLITKFEHQCVNTHGVYEFDKELANRK